MKLVFPCLLLAASISMYKSQGYGARGGSGTTYNNQGFRGIDNSAFRGSDFNDPGFRRPGSIQGQTVAPVYANYRFEGYGRINLGPTIDQISDSVIRELQRLVDEEGYMFENFLKNKKKNVNSNSNSNSYSNSYTQASSSNRFIGVSQNNVDSYYPGGAAGRQAAAGYSSYFP